MYRSMYNKYNMFLLKNLYKYIYISNFTKIIRNNISNKYLVKKFVSCIIFIMNLK